MSKVFLSAGHGGTDPGAVGNGLKEKDINLNILLACKNELKRHGVTVICSRISDEDDRVGDEVKEANDSGADVAVSFHTNAGGGDGSESFYYGTSSKGKTLAELCEKYTKSIGQNSRGTKNGSHLYFIKRTKMPAVLCECAFIDNIDDVQIIDTLDEQKAFGVAYAKAILEYLGISYINPNPAPAPVPQEAPIPANNGYMVKITCDTLRVRTGPGTNYYISTRVYKNEVYTIVGEKNGWGQLKSGAGWISLNYTKRVNQ